MTGFGRAAGENQRYRVSAAVRSVNHRNLDLAIRLADEHRDKEARVRELLAAEMTRGRVEARVEIEFVGRREVRVRVQRDLVEALHEAVDELAADRLLEGGLSLHDVARFPDAVRVESEAADWLAADQELLERVVGDALAQAVEARAAEGARLAEALAGRLELLGGLVARLGERLRSVRGELRERLEARLRELLADRALPEERLAQEAALLVERSDVREELDRLEAHLAQYRGLLAADGALGKRLDFLAQEMARELNTVSAKCRDTEMTQWALDARLACDQMREQAQNVE